MSDAVWCPSCKKPIASKSGSKVTCPCGHSGGVLRARLVALGIAVAAVVVLTGCTSDADKASKNLSTAAEQFEVQRRIVGINGITDKPAFEVEGRCSIENEGNNLVVICKHGPDDLRKHFVGLSDNTFFVATQLEGMPADVFKTRILIKPENIIPDFDLETSG